MKQAKLFVSLAITVFALNVASDCRASIEADTVQINFRQSRTNLDISLGDNNHSIKMLHNILTDLEADSTTAVIAVEVVGAASPEGSLKFNQWLSHERAKRIFNIVPESKTLRDARLTEHFLGRDWGGLNDYIQTNEGTPFRNEIAEVLRRTEDSDSLLLNLKRLRGGEPYLWLYHNVFPSLRRSSIVLRYVRGLQPMNTDAQRPWAVATFAPQPSPAPTIVVAPFTERKGEKPFYMAIKTNMLLDAALVPHLGAEFYLGKDWSIAGQWMYAWWKSDRAHNYWRTYGGDLTIRRWLGKAAKEKPLTGHHLGIFGQMFTYDLELGGRGYIGGVPGGTMWDKANYGGGIEYGYSLPIAHRLNIDFTVGAGYMTGKYYEYLPIDNHYVWQATRKLRWFGPTKLEVSLVWLIGRGNTNVKGGRR